jgi:hypothetical protein
MKRKYLILIITLILILSSIFLIKSQKSKGIAKSIVLKPETIIDIPYGDNKNEVGFNWLNDKSGICLYPQTFFIGKDKNIYILDSVKKRGLVIDENSEFVKSIDLNCIGSKRLGDLVIDSQSKIYILDPILGKIFTCVDGKINIYERLNYLFPENPHFITLNIDYSDNLFLGYFCNNELIYKKIHNGEKLNINFSTSKVDNENNFYLLKNDPIGTNKIWLIKKDSQGKEIKKILIPDFERIDLKLIGVDNKFRPYLLMKRINYEFIDILIFEDESNSFSLYSLNFTETDLIENAIFTSGYFYRVTENGEIWFMFITKNGLRMLKFKVE